MTMFQSKMRVEEMPLLSEIDQLPGTKVLLVSMDEIKHLESRVVPFVEKHKITPEVVVLGDENYSAWLDRVDSSWYGALPATLMLKDGERHFRFGAYETHEELINDLEKVQQ